jgi:hypothetical protein
MAFNLKGAAEGAASGAVAGSVVPGWGTAIGAVVGGIAGAFSGPEAPKSVPLDKADFGKTANESISVNKQTLEKSKGLVQDTNTFNQSEALRLLEIALPGFTEVSSSLLASAKSDVANMYTLPPELEANINRKAAEAGITRGTAGQFESFNLLRDFGFNMIDYSNAKRISALNTLSTLTGITPKVSPMSPMSMFFSPHEMIAQRSREAEIQQGIGQSAANAETKVDNYNRAGWGQAAIIAATQAGGLYDHYANRPKSGGGAPGFTPSKSNYGTDPRNPLAFGTWGELTTLGAV